MEPLNEKIILNDAASRYGRWLRALDPGYAKPDSRSFSDLLNFAVEYGSLVNFYNLQDEVDGDWAPFFASDPAMVLASIIAAGGPETESRFKRLERETLEAPAFDQKFELLRQTFDLILGLARTVNGWLTGLDPRLDNEFTRLLREDVTAAIEDGLGEQLRKLKGYDLGAGLPGELGRPIGLDYSGFSPVWELDRAFPDASIYSGRKPARKIDRAVGRLAPILYALLDAAANLESFARSYLLDTMDTGDHKPDVALYIAFCGLFKTAQDSINTFSSRYLNFYYRGILKETNRGPIPDSVYLTFTLTDSENVFSANVPGATLFPAGQDLNEREIVYGLDKELVVTAAQVAKLRTLRVVSGPLFTEAPAYYSTRSITPAASADSSLARPSSPNYAEPLPIVSTEIFSSEILMPEEQAEATGAAEASTQTSWATFGRTKAGKTKIEITEYATLGFALASSYLLLTGGERTVGIGVRYSDEFETILNLLLDQISLATGLAPEAVFQAVLEDAFNLYVSTSGGWVWIAEYSVTLTSSAEADAPGFELWFKLPPSVPPVAAFDPESGGETAEGVSVSDDPIVNQTNPVPSLPTLKAYLRQQPVVLDGPAGSVSVYPISLLGEMPVTSFNIRTEVFDLADLQVENTDGEVDTSIPFLVFGGLPVVGSYMQVRSRELFVKMLDWIQMRIGWFNLPQNSDGFKGYYKYYVIGPDGKETKDLFDNQVFRGAVTVQNPGYWLVQNVFIEPPPSLPEDVYLFRTREDCQNSIPTKDGKLCADTGFDTLKVTPLEPSPYYNPDDSSIRLALSEPSYGFGYDLYAQNVLKSVIDDLPDAAECNDKCAAQAQPLADAAACVSQCREACQQAGTDEEYKTCIENCLSCCADDLAEAVIERLIACLLKCPAPRGSKVEARLRSCLTEANTHRSRCITQIVNGLKASLGGGVLACIHKCWAGCAGLVEGLAVIEEAILCVAACTIGAEDPDPAVRACADACLEECEDQLKEAHANFLVACIDACMSAEKQKELKYPNEPYLPQATSVSINYAAHCSIQTTASPITCGLFYHLMPFGGYRRVDTNTNKEPPLLPETANPGNLYIGFSRLIPPQTLTLLCQMAAQTGSQPAKLPQVQWDYLSGNQWTRLQAMQIRADSTNGFRNTGVVALSLPTYDPSNNTVLTGDYQWLRASAAARPGGFPNTIGIYAQAGLATWRNIDNTGESLRQALPAHTISSSVQDLPDIAQIDQPMESFGGSPPEDETSFEIRVGERLQHKDRGILGWDYERLVLERFPTIWKVEALPARNTSGGDAPGGVLLVVVPGADSREVLDPAAPAASSELLAAIQSYIESLISPFISLQVVNPVYVRIEVITTVEFVSGEDTGACIDRLNDELVEYLSPWYYDASRARTEGQYASESEISEFIQTRPYVAAMFSIEFYYDPDPAGLDWYFLTSAIEHDISAADAGRG